MSITEETRREAHEKVMPVKHDRRMNILKVLREKGPQTAEEIADELYRQGEIPLCQPDVYGAAPYRAARSRDRGDHRKAGKPGERTPDCHLERGRTVSGSRSRRHYRRFRCPECGEMMTAPKKRNTAIGHIKTMWCWRCKAMRDFVQVGEDGYVEVHSEKSESPS